MISYNHVLPKPGTMAASAAQLLTAAAHQVLTVPLFKD